MSRILHLTSAHTPFDTRIFHKECRSLAADGHHVTLAVPGAVDGVIDGVTLVGLPASVGRLDRFCRQPLRLLRIGWQTDADVVHFHDPELLGVGLLLALAGRRVIYDSHEVLPLLVRGRTWLPVPIRSVAASLLGVVERWSVGRMAAVVTAEPAGADRFGRAVHTVRNLPLQREWECLPARAEGPDVVYVGSISDMRGAYVMIDAMEQVGAETGARLLLAGTGPTALLDALRARPGWVHVDYVGPLARSDVIRVLTSARVGLAVFQPIEQYRDATDPVKLFEYLAAGLVVVCGDYPRFRAIVGDTGAAEFVDATDADAVADAIIRVLRLPDLTARGLRGRERVLASGTWESEYPALRAAYAEALG